MNNDAHHTLLFDYYNGHLEKEEEQAFEEHLAGCPECQEELAELKELNAELAEHFEQVDPPAGMQERILTNIFEAGPEEPESETASNEADKDNNESVRNDDQKTHHRPKRSHGFYKKLLIPIAAALLLSVIGNVYLWTSQQASQPLNEALFNEGKAIDLDPASDTLEMDAKMAMHESNGSQTVVLKAQNFTNLNEGEVYQVWLLKGDQPYRAGTMVPNEKGEGYAVFTLDDNENTDWDAVAVTVEPSPQNETPQGDILMSAEF